jgi:hypothetical protein
VSGHQAERDGRWLMGERVKPTNAHGEAAEASDLPTKTYRTAAVFVESAQLPGVM